MMITMPRDENGRFVPLACPVPTCGGTLRYQGHRSWECDGLVDPENPNRLWAVSGAPYGNSTAQNYDFPRAYCEAWRADRAFRHVLLAQNEPEPQIGAARPGEAWALDR